MESLIKKNNLLSMKVPGDFITEFDKWRDEEGKKNKTNITRNMGFNFFREIIPYINVDIKTNRKKKEIKINIK